MDEYTEVNRTVTIAMKIGVFRGYTIRDTPSPNKRSKRSPKRRSDAIEVSRAMKITVLTMDFTRLARYVLPFSAW